MPVLLSAPARRILGTQRVLDKYVWNGMSLCGNQDETPRVGGAAEKLP